MPKRTRGHRLETASQRAFASALPENLVVREVSDDYGIDREVEVFVDDQATGLTFKVQLKATDGSGKSRRVKRDALDYWRSLDVPVLLVSYEASTGQLRGRWVHSIGSDGPDPGAKTITVHMDAEVEFSEAWASNLANELSLIRELRQGLVPDPIPVRVTVVPPLDGSLRPAVLTAALLQASRRGTRRMTAASADDAALTFNVAVDRVHVALPLKWASASLRPSAGAMEAAEPRALGEDLLVLAAVAVSAISSTAAGEIAAASVPSSPLWQKDVVAERLGPALATSEAAEFLVALVDYLDQNRTREAEDARLLYEIVLLKFITDVSDELFQRYSDRIRQAASSESPTSLWDAGRRLYNLGHLHKARREFLSAAELFCEAALRDPRYAEDSDFLRHLGSCEWEIEQYTQSASHYRQALERGQDEHELRPLLADSLMYAGEYDAARQALQPWKPIGDTTDRAGIIRRAMLEHIHDVVGVSKQNRTNYDTKTLARDIQAAIAGGPNAEAVVELLRTTDALHPLLWLGLVDDNDLAASFRPALIAAMMLHSEPSAWLVALICALSARVNESMVRAVLDQARFVCDASFYEAVWAAAEDQEPDNADLLRYLVSEAYTSELVQAGTTIRWVTSPESDSWVTDRIWLGAPGSVPPTGTIKE